jgi:hypothetical protein
MNKLSQTLFISMSVLMLLPHQYAQAQTLRQKLADATRLECRFSALATTSWDKDTGAGTATVTPSELESSFFDINIAEGTAEADSRFGASFIIARYTSGYMHLMQLSDAGPLYITTVMAAESTDGRLLAVHVRHEYSPAIIPGFTSRPEMYVGDCAITG